MTLPNEASNADVSSDWRRKFFLEAENICASDLQELWGRVLAGEVGAPGKFSLRTLEALKHLSQREAEAFRVACSLAMQDGWIALPGHDINNALKDFGLSFGAILILRDAGLIMSGDNLAKLFRLAHGLEPSKYKSLLANNGVLIELSGPALTHFNAPSLIFTRAGIELQQLIDYNENSAYLKRLGAFWRGMGVSVKRGVANQEQNGISIFRFDTDL